MGYSGGSLVSLVDEMEDELQLVARRIVDRVGERWLELVAEYTPVAEDPFGDRVRTPGTLRDSWELGDVEVFGRVYSIDVFTEDEIACILGGKTKVRTDRGDVNIAQVQVGDMVLTQTGEFRKVVAASSRPATEMPEMVSISFRGIKGGKSELTVTQDHRVLAYRDGRNLWLRAGELRDGDEMQQARPRYVVCNPSTKSYVSPDTFRRVPIRVRKWTYERPIMRHPRGDRPGTEARVYDLSVDGIHSFVCKGLVVSNSHVEYPTKPHQIRAKPGKSLRFRAKNGDVVFAKAVNHPGTVGARMMGRAAAQIRVELPVLARGV